MTYIKAVEEVAIVEKSVSESKLDNHNEKIEELTEDETAEVNIVPKGEVLIRNNFPAKFLLYLLWMFFRKKFTSLSRFSS